MKRRRPGYFVLQKDLNLGYVAFLSTETTDMGTSPARITSLAPASAVQRTFSIDELHRTRQFVYREAILAGLDAERATDLVVAANEIAENSIRHGKAGGRIRMWHEPEVLICEVDGRGQMTDPLAGRQRPVAGQSSGYGLWMVDQLCDLVEIRSVEDHTTVRLHMSVPASWESGEAPRGN